jgi:ketosteroid isomerase-like protein
MKLLMPVLFFCLAVSTARAQTFPKINISQTPEHLERLKEIDRDIWMPFSEAYAASDADKYLALHTPDFIRANGGTYSGIQNLTEYTAEIKAGFARSKGSGKPVQIDFTFFERIAGPETASERGIYRYASVNKNGENRNYYGKFHVFLRKINGTWKIAVDYDSDEDGSIGEADFAAGMAPKK